MGAAMDLELSQSEIALQTRARAFAHDIAGPRAAAVDRDEQYPWDIAKALAAAGFCGMTVSPELGGQGRSFLDAVLVIEEMAKVCSVTCKHSSLDQHGRNLHRDGLRHQRMRRRSWPRS